MTTAPAHFAARAWWLLAWLGKRDGVFILDGGLKAWHVAGFPLSLDAPVTEPGTFAGTPDNHLLLDAEHLQKRLGQPGLTLIDARAQARFRGDVEPIDPIAGHIPGAQCAAFNENLGSDGRFLPADQLRQRFAAQLQGRSPEDLVAYCGSGCDGLPQPVRPESGGLSVGQVVCGVVERVDYRSCAGNCDWRLIYRSCKPNPNVEGGLSSITEYQSTHY